MLRRRQRRYDENTKERARELRRKGYTYTEIIDALGGDIPKNTISGWVSDIDLTPEQEERIRQKILKSGDRGRPLAAAWNRRQKQLRMERAWERANPVARRLAQDSEALQLMAAALYMGEGAKAEKAFTFGNSDPDLIRTWLALLRRNFDIDESKFRCQLAISEGMDEEELKGFWSEVTGIPVSQFYPSSVRKRSGHTREGYKGVCIVHYFSLAIRRYLDALGRGVIEELLREV